jgi:hypothetical protein
MERNRSWGLGNVIGVVVLLVAGPIGAEWLAVQGNVAMVQNPERLVYPTGNNWGWGLDFFLKANQSTWVQVPVPSLADRGIGARYVKIKFWTASDAWVQSIHVYNGEVKVGEWDGPWSAGDHTLKLDFGVVRSFNRGLSFAILFQSGSNADDGTRQAQVHSASGNFVPMP